jgi:hypothetical protein
MLRLLEIKCTCTEQSTLLHQIIFKQTQVKKLLFSLNIVMLYVIPSTDRNAVLRRLRMSRSLLAVAVLRHTIQTNVISSWRAWDKITAVWDVMLCSVVDEYQSLGGTYCICLHFYIWRQEIPLKDLYFSTKLYRKTFQ